MKVKALISIFLIFFTLHRTNTQNESFVSQLLKIYNETNSLEAERELETKILLLFEVFIEFSVVIRQIGKQVDELLVWNGEDAATKEFENILTICASRNKMLQEMKDAIEKGVPLSKQLEVFGQTGYAEMAKELQESSSKMNSLYQKMLEERQEGFAKLLEDSTKAAELVGLLAKRVEDSGMSALTGSFDTPEGSDSEIEQKGQVAIKLVTVALFELRRLQSIADKLEALGYYTNASTVTPDMEAQVKLMESGKVSLVELILKGKEALGPTSLLSYALYKNKRVSSQLPELQKQIKERHDVVFLRMEQVRKSLEETHNIVLQMGEITKNRKRHVEL